MSSNTKETAEQNKLKISAISLVFEAIKELEIESAIQVLKMVAALVDPHSNWTTSAKSGVYADSKGLSNQDIDEDVYKKKSPKKNSDSENPDDQDNSDENQDDNFGLSAPGARWLKRNSITAESASSIFSLGADEIEVVTNSLPANSSSGKLRQAFLLQGIAALLSTGSPRFKHEDAKELCEHYGAWDPTNAVKYIKRLAGLVSGSRATGYQLTAKGLVDAATLIKSLLGTDKG